MSYATPWKAGAAVIELGGGDRPAFRPNVDSRPMPTVDVVADLGQRLPLEADQYDGVFSHYAIEHVSWRQVRTLIAEAFRILKPGGTAVFVTANLAAQARYILSREEEGWDDSVVGCIFGDLDYPENSHKCGFNPEYARKLFLEAGFEAVFTLPWGALATDMLIEARKPTNPAPELWTPEERRRAYNRHYFDGGRGGFGGYSREGYWDYPVHWVTFEKLRALKPESVLELGPARGYILKRFLDAGIPAAGLEVSRHCYLTRACEGVIEWDLTQTPWPYADKQFDLCYSMAVLEHIPASKIEDVAAEIRRVSRRGLHGVDFGDHDDGFDKTHCLFRDAAWWKATLNGSPEGGPQEAVEKDDLERGPVPLPPADGRLKLNCGSFRTMFHHGWLNIDHHPLEDFARQYNYRFLKADLRAGLPFGEASVEALYASHFLEHLTYEEGARFLASCRKALKPGAVARFVVPDALTLVKGYLGRHLWAFDEISDAAAATPYYSRKLWELLFSGHQAAYDEESLMGALRAAGFTTVQRMAFRESLDPAIPKETIELFPDFSLFVDAKA